MPFQEPVQVWRPPPPWMSLTSLSRQCSRRVPPHMHTRCECDTRDSAHLQVISADPSWRDNLEFALNLINKKGGPQVMLKPPDYSFTRRYLLENLATHDVFSKSIRSSNRWQS